MTSIISDSPDGVFKDLQLGKGKILDPTWNEFNVRRPSGAEQTTRFPIVQLIHTPQDWPTLGYTSGVDGGSTLRWLVKS